MKLPNGTYRTKAGSSVTISGTHGGRSVVEFDWCEEPLACIECKVDPDPQWDVNRWILYWECKECDGGFAELLPGEAA